MSWQSPLSMMPGKVPTFLLLATALAVSTSCGHPPQPPPQPLPPCPGVEPIDLDIRASGRLNLGEKGESLATTVRLYQLRDLNRLSAATLEQVLDDERTALAEELVSSKEIIFYPGEVTRLSLDRRDGALYVAVVAFFRHPTGSAWRVATKLDPPNPQYCHAPGDKAAGPTKPGLRFGLVENRVDLQ